MNPHEAGSLDSQVTHKMANWQRRFWAIFIGQAFSLIGSAMTQFVLMWWITLHVGSASSLAYAGVAALLPQAILAPLGGTLADRYSRRVIMIVSDSISALCMVLLIVLFSQSSAQLWQIYLLMAIRSAMQAFQSPAAAASMAMLVPGSFLARAAGLNQTLYGIMTIAAVPLGALALSIMPMEAALSIDVVTAILGICPLLIYSIPQHRLAKGSRNGLWQEFTEGVGLVWKSRGLRTLYIVLAVTVMVLMPTFTMVPLLVTQHFKGGAGHVALMEGLAGAGMVLGGLAVAALDPKRRILTTLAGFTAACLTLAFAGMASSEAFVLACFWWAISGFCFTYGNAPMTAALQSVIPNRLQGRALSLQTSLTGLAAPLGLLAAGSLAEVFGIRVVFIWAGLLGTLISILAFLSPSLRHLEQEKI